MAYLRKKFREPGWYWTRDGDGEWSPARYSIRGWEPSLCAGTAYFTDDEVGEIGPMLPLPHPSRKVG